MEAEAAGVLWPQLSLKSSPPIQLTADSDSESEEADTSQAQISSTPIPGEDTSRKIFRAEKRKRKAERAAKRAAKQARRQARESAASSSRLIQDEKEEEVEEVEEPLEEDILVPQSSALARPSLSFPEVSTSPVEDEEKEDDEISTQSIKDDVQPTEPYSSVETNPTTQPWTAPQVSLSPTATPTPSVSTQSSSAKDKGEGKASQKSTNSSKPFARTETPTSLDTSADDESSIPTRPKVKKDKGKGRARQQTTSPSKPIARTDTPASLDTSASDDESSIPEQADLEAAFKASASEYQSRPNENGTGNAEAGPSKSRSKKTKPPTTPARKTPRKPRQSNASEGRTMEKEDDESLRRRLANPTAAHEFIASHYWQPPYLKRLEEAGIITLVSGKLSDAEINAVRRHLDIFMRTNRLDSEQLVEVIMAKATNGTNARESYPTFWPDIALQLPGRPLRYVVKQIQRMYDPRARQGKWSEKEDAELRRAYEIHPGMWTKIAAIIDRTEQDCRDRYNKEIANSDKRNIGTWTTHEEDMLREAVLEANRAIGNVGLSMEAPWEVISAKLGYQRGPTQCRTKWHRDLYPREKGTPSTSNRAPKPKPVQAMTLAAKRAGVTPSPKKRKSPVVLLNSRPKKKAPEYKSQDVISNSGSEDEKNDDKEDGEMDEDDA